MLIYENQGAEFYEELDGDGWPLAQTNTQANKKQKFITPAMVCFRMSTRQFTHKTQTKKYRKLVNRWIDDIGKSDTDMHNTRKNGKIKERPISNDGRQMVDKEEKEEKPGTDYWAFRSRYIQIQIAIAYLNRYL